jgi:hypothetical protein
MILSLYSDSQMIVICQFELHINSQRTKGHFQAFLEVWASHYEGHIYKKIVNKIVNRWFSTSFKAY